MNELQRKVDELIQKQGGYWPPFQMLAALVEEVGELADVMLAVEGVKGHGEKERLEEELGDVLYALLCIANYYGIDASHALETTVIKYSTRDT
ncbi:MazG nucleotide pyrophosphohydrolase domain-containing protein [Thermococcus stetteri]|uniref:MazG nucleotide pyrophosphohydrolase domain-containing protein n=1 Tax=Thermococcus stetteri TaxID=49900 RepID=UPI001AE1587E|nr:MazG nucleotide pyrophosphohydrolase domain-containing protein [Thermococcus stetteri]MBP1912486.1 NTP pyrophosphatase (non-canonical NTP hydrolase) [Thermococcus stetteri]